jgi:hypothetical protein
VGRCRWKGFEAGVAGALAQQVDAGYDQRDGEPKEYMPRSHMSDAPCPLTVSLKRCVGRWKRRGVSERTTARPSILFAAVATKKSRGHRVNLQPSPMTCARVVNGESTARSGGNVIDEGSPWRW